jgi:RND superfamily putative drug exporter
LFSRLGSLVTRRPRQILVVAGVGLVLATFAGVHASAKLRSAGFVSSGAPSQVAADLLDAHFGGGSPNLVLVVRARSGSVDSPQVATAGTRLEGRLAAQVGVSSVTSWWTARNPALKSRDGKEALILGHIDGSDAQVTTRAKALIRQLSVQATTPGPITVSVGGLAGTNAAIGIQLGKDLRLAEAIAVPLTLLVLIVVFGSVVAAALPVLLGLVAIISTLAVMWVLAGVTDVSVYALNLTTAMGLGLAVDYSLLMVSRYREELTRGLDPTAAVRETLNCAGRTIVFSAAAVSAAMAVLLVFPVDFLRSFAYAGVAVVALASLAALVILPCLLAVLGHRVDALRVPWRRTTVANGGESPFWRRAASIILARPVVAGLPAVAVLLAMGVPFLHVHFGTPDGRVLPSSNPTRQADSLLRSQFALDSADTLDAVSTPAPGMQAAAAYSRQLSSIAGITQVVGPAGTWRDGTQIAAASPAVLARYQTPDAAWFSADLADDPQSGAARGVVRQARALQPPPGTTVVVGGAAAQLVDELHDISTRLPIALALIALTTFLVLFAFTGSLILPIKALLLNALGLSAVLGAIVWVFQQGHLSGLLGFTPTPLVADMPMLLFCIAFGLSMDYEMFVLSRIKELHDHGAANTVAIREGLARTGRIVTTAAALFDITFFAFASSKVSFIKMFGLGTGLAILLDATLIRGVLVPAFMGLAGEWNWWAPRALRLAHGHLGLSEVRLPPRSDPRASRGSFDEHPIRDHE